MHGTNVNFPFQEPRFYPTQCDIPEDIRIQIVECLNQTLATSLDLNSQIQQAIWTLRGINFYPFYLLLNGMSVQNNHYIHILAARIRALASTPLVSVRMAGQYSQLPEFPFGENTTEKTLQLLAYRVALHGHWVRCAIAQMIELDDRVTADIYTQFSRTLDHHRWLLEAHYISE